jgi:hypothetical protein
MTYISRPSEVEIWPFMNRTRFASGSYGPARESTPLSEPSVDTFSTWELVGSVTQPTRASYSVKLSPHTQVGSEQWQLPATGRHDEQWLPVRNFLHIEKRGRFFLITATYREREKVCRLRPDTVKSRLVCDTLQRPGNGSVSPLARSSPNSAYS